MTAYWSIPFAEAATQRFLPLAIARLPRPRPVPKPQLTEQCHGFGQFRAATSCKARAFFCPAAKLSLWATPMGRDFRSFTTVMASFMQTRKTLGERLRDSPSALRRAVG